MNAPLIAPTDVPTTMSGRMSRSIRARSIPTCIAPRLAPPERTNATLISYLFRVWVLMFPWRVVAEGSYLLNAGKKRSLTVAYSVPTQRLGGHHGAPTRRFHNAARGGLDGRARSGREVVSGRCRAQPGRTSHRRARVAPRTRLGRRSMGE